MKKKLLIIAGVFIGLVILVLGGLTLYVKSYLQSDKLKALIIPKAEQATGRKISIDTIDVSIFSGISIKGMRMKERDESADFAAIKEFVLKYEFMPLLSKKVIIDSIRIVEPALNVRRDRNGKFNFEDISENLKSMQKEKKPNEAKPESGLPFSVTADKITIKDAKIDFLDMKKELPHLTSLADADITFSLGREPGTISYTSKVTLKSLDAVIGSVSTRTAGTIDLDPEKLSYDLNSSIGGDTVSIKGSIANYRTAPNIRLDLYSKQLDLAKFAALGSGGAQEKPAEKAGEKKGSTSEPGKKMQITAAGQIKVDTALYQGNTVKNFAMNYAYAHGSMNIDPVSLNFASGQKADLSGSLKGRLVFNYAPEKGAAAEQVKRSVAGNAVVELDKVQIKESKISDAVAAFTGLEDLRRPSFDKGHFDIRIGGEKMTLSGLMTNPRVKVVPTGSVGFNKAIDMLTDIQVSPELASKMRVAKYTGYLESKDGWSIIPLKITGTTDKPSVGLNPAAMRKQLQKGIQSEIQKRLFKDGSQEQQGEKPKDLLKGIFGK